MCKLLAAAVCALIVISGSAHAENIYREENGLAVVEVESAPVTGSWTTRTDNAGYTGSSFYVWKHGDLATGVDAAGSGVLSYKIRITQTGRYRFQVRSAAPHNTEHNDVWVRFPTSGALRMKNNTYTSLGTAWTKVYQNSGNNSWSWNSSTVDNDPHSIHADFNSAGDYVVEFSGRSTQFKIDRFVFYHTSVTTASATSSSNPQSPLAAAGPTGTVTGELKKWHKVSITFDGPSTSETANPNPFTDYRLNVTFTKGTKTFIVPGYYAADGNAGESSAASGNKWRVHFAPDETGTWNYSASFRTGTNIAVDANADAGSATSFNGASGSFVVAASDKTGRDLRGKGRLQYTGARYLRFADSGEYFVKAGPDSPENMLGYSDIDGTSDHAGGSLKSWSPHVSDWTSSDVSWKSGKGKGLIGAINYLASEGCNVFSFLTYNSGGDGKDVWPFIAHDNKLRYDCSKLDQWGMIFEHGTRKGFYLHFKTQETENDNESPWALDGGNVALERKLYYRELIARFSHNLALNWNLGEETTQTTAQHQAMAQYFFDTDPYHHNVVLHTYPGQQDQRYTPLLGNNSKLTGTSIQTGWDNVHKESLKWVNNSRNAGKKWVIANDEQGSASIGIPEDGFTGTPTQKQCRNAVLWGNLLAGGAGVECYFGYQRPHSDLTCEDFRSRDQWWDSCRHALSFFNSHINFWEMESANGLVGNSGNNNDKFCFAKIGGTYAVYLANGSTTTLNLSGQSGSFEVKWYNPRSGGALQNGSVASVNGGGSVALGNPPSDASEDWVILVRRTGTPPTTFTLTVNSGNGDGAYASGAVVNIGADAPLAGQVFDKWTGATQYVADVNSPNTSVTMPAANITVTATYKQGTATQSVASLTLVNADTDQDIQALIDGATLNLATLPTRNLNVRANTNPATVGSVRFAYDSNNNYATESVAPYALGGDTNGNYKAWTPVVGAHSITATPFSAASGGGTAGTAFTANFTVIDDASAGLPNAPSVLAATATSASQINLNWTDNANNETGFQIQRKTGAGGAFAQVGTVGANATTFQDNGLSASTLFVYRVRATNATGNSAFSNEASATTQTPPPPAPSISALILVNADSDTDIGPLSNGATLDLSTLPTRNLNVRAETSPASVGSVIFNLDGALVTENQAVYALAGNTGNDYNAWTPSLGAHTLTVTPYSSSNGGGTAGTAVTVSFTVVEGPVVTALILVNADNEQDIGPLTTGMTLNLSTLPTANLNVRAVTHQPVGSVRFAYDGNGNFRTENVAPYAFAGDNSGNYNNWTPTNGSHTLTATPYSGSAASGTAGGALTVSFTVSGSAQAVLAAFLPAGTSGDSDGDGLLDAYELSAGFDPFNWDSNGNGVADLEEIDPDSGLFAGDLQTQWLLAGGGATPGNVGELLIQKLAARIKLNKSGVDTIAIKGSLPTLDPGQLGSNQNVRVTVAGESTSFTLDAKLRGKAATGRLAFKAPRASKKNPAVSGTSLDVKLKRGAWGEYALGAGSGVNGTAGVKIPVTLEIGGTLYSATQDVTYKGRAGKGGVLKL